MTKFFVYNNLEFNYDELESNEIRLYSTPDDFKFDEHLMKRFFESKNIKCELDEGLCFYWTTIDKNKKYRCYSDMHWLMDRNTSSKQDGIEKGEFLEWLKTQGVEELKYELI